MIELDKVAAMPTPTAPERRANVVDLCSGFGYLGMFLAEMLDPAKVQRVILLDKQWPMFGIVAAAHQIQLGPRLRRRLETRLANHARHA